jgi:hypothetical protein
MSSGGRINSCTLTGCCPKPLAITSRVMLPESSLALMNISHLRCGPVGVRFIESRFAGRHKCRPYKDLKRKFLYYQVTNLEQPHCVNCIWATACQVLTLSYYFRRVNFPQTKMREDLREDLLIIKQSSPKTLLTVFV